jgi:hypothetical protein
MKRLLTLAVFAALALGVAPHNIPYRTSTRLGSGFYQLRTWYVDSLGKDSTPYPADSGLLSFGPMRAWIDSLDTARGWSGGGTGTTDTLKRGYGFYARGTWTHAGESLAINDTVIPSFTDLMDSVGFYATSPVVAGWGVEIHDDTAGHDRVSIRRTDTDTAYGKPNDSAIVAANSHTLQGQDTTALWNAKTLQGKDTTALWKHAGTDSARKGIYDTLGIGTAAPVYPLHIKDKGAGAYLAFQDIYSNTPFIMGIPSYSDKFFFSSTYGGTDFNVKLQGASSRMVLKAASGNFGLGETLPLNRLDVKGAAVIGATYSGINTAPANGLLVEGVVVFDSTAARGTEKLFVKGNGLISGHLTVDSTTKSGSFIVGDTVMIRTTGGAAFAATKRFQTYADSCAGVDTVNLAALNASGARARVITLRDSVFVKNGATVITTLTATGKWCDLEYLGAPCSRWQVFSSN